MHRFVVELRDDPSGAWSNVAEIPITVTAKVTPEPPKIGALSAVEAKRPRIAQRIQAKS